MENNILKVSKMTNPNSLASAISLYLDKINIIELHCIGAGAVNQAAKAIAIARGMCATKGLDLTTIIGFIDVNVNDEQKTGLKFIVKKV